MRSVPARDRHHRRRGSGTTPGNTGRTLTGPSFPQKVAFVLRKEHLREGGCVKKPEGGKKNRKIGSARSAEEKNEASRGSYDTTMKPQLLGGMGGCPRLKHAHRPPSRQQFSSEVSGLISVVLSLFLLWLHQDIVTKVSLWEKKSRKEPGRLYYISLFTGLCSLSLKTQVH